MSTPGGTPKPASPSPASGAASAATGARSAVTTSAPTVASPTVASPTVGAGGRAASGGVAGNGAAATGGATTGRGPGAAVGTATTAARPAPSGAGAPAARVAGAPTGSQRQAPRPTGRRVRLAVARIDPWSAMKMSFLLSFAAGVGLVVATMVLWMILSGMNVFNDIDGLVRSLQPNSADPFSIMDWIGFPRVTSLSMVIAVIDVILLTALGTLGAYLYNICSSLVGGVQLTLTDD